VTAQANTTNIDAIGSHRADVTRPARSYPNEANPSV
jgi:hypothetical protein